MVDTPSTAAEDDQHDSDKESEDDKQGNEKESEEEMKPEEIEVEVEEKDATENDEDTTITVKKLV